MSRLLSHVSLNRCDLYLAIYALYELQGLLYPAGAVGVALQGVLLLWAFVAAGGLLLPSPKTPLFLRFASLLVAMYAVYGLLLIAQGIEYRFSFGGVTRPHVYLQASLNSLMPIYLMFKYARDGLLTASRIRVYFWIFIPICVGLYIKAYMEQLAKYESLDGKQMDEITNNSGYLFLALLPYLFFIRRLVWRYIGLAIVVGIIAVSLKRGAIMLAAICGVWVLIATVRNTGMGGRKLGAVFMVLVCLLGAGSFATYLYQNNDAFRIRVHQTLKGNTSRRDILYTRISTNILTDPSVTHALVGNGANSTIKVAGNYAHNDWLETAHNNGLLGIVLLTAFYVAMLVTIRRDRKELPSLMLNSFAMVLFTSLSTTIFSMSIQNMHLPTTMLVGYFTAQNLTIPRHEKSRQQLLAKA